MQFMESRIDSWISENKQALIDELTAWVRIRSVSDEKSGVPGAPFGAGCREMLTFALERGRAMGFDTVDHEGYAGSITFGSQPEDIGFVGHIDVVPEGNDWIYAPYDPVILGKTDRSEGFLVGRGSDDNKGEAVAALFAMKCVKDLGIPMRHRLQLILGCSEETGMEDMKYFTEQSRKADSGVRMPLLTIVPDAAYPVCYAQKGRFVLELTLPCGAELEAFEGGSVPNAVPDRARAAVRFPAGTAIPSAEGVTAEESDGITRFTAVGKAAHAAGPDGSINAVGRLADALSGCGSLSPETAHAMEVIRTLLQDNYGSGANIAMSDEVSGRLTFTLGIARLENGVLTLTMDCRYPVTADAEEIRSRLRARLAELRAGIRSLVFEPAFYMEENDPRVKALTEAYREITGDTESRNYTMGGGTYSKNLPNAITFGGGFPGRANVVPRPETPLLPAGHGGCHGPDEIVSLDALLTTVKIFVCALMKVDAVV